MADRDSMPAGVDRLLLLREIEAFLIAELALLDAGDLAGWRELFTEDGTYWAPARPDQANPLDEISLFYDDREIMDLRIRRLRHPRVHAQIPHTRTSHVVGNFALTSADHENGAYAFRCRFVVHEYRPETAQRAFSGRYDYTVVRAGASFKIRAKKATVINCDDVHFPISIPI